MKSRGSLVTAKGYCPALLIYTRSFGSIGLIIDKADDSGRREGRDSRLGLERRIGREMFGCKIHRRRDTLGAVTITFVAVAYGIDFGTTNSTICVVDGSGVRKLGVDPEASNPAIMRSVMYVSPQKRYLFGKPAVDAYLIDVAQNKEIGKTSVFTGRQIKVGGVSTSSGVTPDRWVDEIIEVDVSANGRLFQGVKSILSRQSVEKVEVFGEDVEIVSLVGRFLAEMKQRADGLLGMEVERAVFGRPIEYVGGNNNLAVERMTKAAEMAGFKEVQFEYEPVGAALDYGVDITTEQMVLIFDFGGGTLDLSVIRFPAKEFLAHVGLAIGGDHFNSEFFLNKLARHFGKDSTYGFNRLPVPRWVYEQLKNWYMISLLKTETFKKSIDNFRFLNSQPGTIEALESLIFNNLGFTMYEEIDRVKVALSGKGEERYLLKAPAIEIEELIPRQDFEEIVLANMERVEDVIEVALRSAGIRTENVDVVATTGGSSLIPMVQLLLARKFGAEKVRSKDAFTSVAAGLAWRAREVF